MILHLKSYIWSAGLLRADYKLVSSPYKSVQLRYKPVQFYVTNLFSYATNLLRRDTNHIAISVNVSSMHRRPFFAEKLRVASATIDPQADHRKHIPLSTVLRTCGCSLTFKSRHCDRKSNGKLMDRIGSTRSSQNAHAGRYSGNQ